MITVKLLPPLSRLVGRKELQLDFAGGTVGNVVADLVAVYPPLAKEIGPEAGEERYYYAVFVNGMDSRSQQGPATPVADGDEVVILMPMGGGQ